MNPVLLTRSEIERGHTASLALYGGLPGLRSEQALDSALAAPQNDFHYGGTDLFGMAAAHAFHLAQAQAFVDGNKRTAIIAAIVFLEGNGVRTDHVETYDLHLDMLAIAEHRSEKSDLAERFRVIFAPED